MTDLQQKAREALARTILAHIVGQTEPHDTVDALSSLTWRQATNGEVKSDVKVVVFQHPEQEMPVNRFLRSVKEKGIAYSHEKVDFTERVELAMYDEGWRRTLEE